MSAGTPPAPPSELERSIAESIQQNPLVQWVRSHPTPYQAIAPGVTLLIAILIYVALRTVLFLPLMRFLGKREAKAREATIAAKQRHGLPLVRAVRETKLINALAWILPCLVAWRGIHLWPELLPAVSETFGRVMLSIGIAFGLLAFARVLSCVDIVMSERLGRPGAIRGYVQAISAIVGAVGGVTIISILLGRSPIYFLTGVGAFAALLAVVLKDTLLSMYANILMTTGDTLRVGDWIEMRQHGLDGRVEEIRLTSTKVRNWDETTLTVPNYRFVSEIFVNYRTQNPKGGRRMKRSIRLDQRTVRELTEAELVAASAVTVLHQPVAIARAAATLAAGGAASVVTNLALYRAYLERFLAVHPLLDRSRPIVVRQNEPMGTGVLIDVLCFYQDSELKDYETLQSGMLDHFTAVAAVFGLRIYQQGSDLNVAREPFAFLSEDQTRLLSAAASG
ncbi:MAG: mechanosensitive ion channel family protein [Phycisphaerae bacterium]|nr:mechanosensitive ion channel family protein [Phycisphaerae bacterium]